MVVRIYDWLVRLAPQSAFDLRQPAARETFREVCRSARSSGWLSYAMESGRELFNIAAVIAAAHFAGFGPPKFKFSGAGRDLRMAARSLRAGRAATAIAMITLSLGIGINAAIFSVLDAVIFTEVPFRDHERLVEITNFDPKQKMAFAGMPRDVVKEWRSQGDLFDRIEAYQSGSFVYEANGAAEMITGAAVTPALFDMLGVRPALGRAFSAGEGNSSSAPTAIVNDAFWRKELGGTPDLSSAQIQIDGRTYSVIGVMPRSFRFPTGDEQIWTPFDLQDPPVGSPAGRGMTPLARLAKGMSFDSANTEVRARGSQVNHAAGGPDELSASVWKPGRGVDDKTTTSLWILSGAVAFLFLIVCANVANLALTRTLARARELATCAALGASPANLLRASLFEHALLAGISTVAGAFVAMGAIKIAVAALPAAMTSGTMNVIDLDARALVFMAIAGAAAAILFGLPPAFIASRASLAQVIGGESRSTSGSRSARRLRSALVIAEVAVSAVLLIGGAMMTRSFIRLSTIDQGFDPADLVTIRLGLPAAGYEDVSRRNRSALDVAARVASLAYVRSVTMGQLPTDHGMINVGKLEFERDPNQTTKRISVGAQEIEPNYFSTIGMPLVDGRTFAAGDPAGAVVISKSIAVKYFDGNAVGQRFRFSGKPWLSVIGVAADTPMRDGAREVPVRIYYPIGAETGAYVMSRAASKIVDFRNVLVRTSRPDELMGSIAGAVSAVDSSIVIWKTARVENELAETIARPRVVFVLLAVFAAFGLLLAMAGLYGVLSCLVTQRRQELGVRLALGASATGVRRLIIGDGMRLCVAGVLLGLGGAIPLVRLMRTVLYDVDPLDTIAIVGSSALLIVTAAFACWWPARDAAKTDPTVLLRNG